MILRSLTSRLIFLYCLILLALGAAFLGFTVFSFRHYAQQVVTNTLVNRTQDIWRIAKEDLNAPERLKSTIEQHFSPESQNRFIRVRLDGKTIYRSGEPISGDFSASEISEALPVQENEIAPVSNVMLYARSFKTPGGKTVLVETGQPQLALTVQERLTKSLLVGLPILLLMAAIAGFVVMRRALTPVESMIRAAETYTFNDLHKRLPTTGNEPRIEALGLALNRMLDRLDNAYGHVSRFSSDAAHELRTPLTIVRGELELIALRNDLPPEIEESLEAVREEMTRLSVLVDSLITLSRMDSLWGKTSHDMVDLSDLMQETIEQMHLMLEEKELAVTGPGAHSILVPGDRGRLKQVMVNLLDNAIKYTPRGGQICLRIRAEGMIATIAVEDTGAGIDPEHQQRVFDRFYRVSPDRGADGAGLGLAIVKAICQAHGGTVRVESTPGEGSCFVVELPLSSSNVTSTAQIKKPARRRVKMH